MNWLHKMSVHCVPITVLAIKRDGGKTTHVLQKPNLETIINLYFKYE